MSKHLSKILIVLFAIRPLLNVANAVKLGNMGEYEVSILSLWSGLVVILILIRLLYKPKLYGYVFKLTIIFATYIIIFGVYRLYKPEAFIKEVLYTIITLLGILIAPKIFSEYSIDYFSKLVFRFTTVLIVIHSTAWIWYPFYIGDVYNYIGLFTDKFISSVTFLSVLPFLYIHAKNTKRNIPRIIFILSIIFLFWTFRRTTILSLIVGACVLLIYMKKIKYVMYMLLLMALVYVVIPQKQLTVVYEKKIQSEYQDYLSGSIERVGAGRIGLYLNGLDLYSKSNLFDKVFGHGSAQSWYLAYLAWGRDMYAHGQFIATLYDYGIIGLSILLTIFTLIAFKIHNRPNDKYKNPIIFGFYSSVSITLSNILIASGGTIILMSVLWGYAASDKLNNSSDLIDYK